MENDRIIAATWEQADALLDSLINGSSLGDALEHAGMDRDNIDWVEDEEEVEIDALRHEQLIADAVSLMDIVEDLL